MIRAARVPPLIAVFGSLVGWAHAASPPPSQVPFVGCPAHGMTTLATIPAPHQAPRTVDANTPIAARIAYYAGASPDWPGAYAPRGWHCRVWFGADGTFMIVTPEPPPDVNPHASITGPGVFASVSYGGTGGRFEVAQVAARFFPQEMRAFIQKIRTGDADLPAAHFVVKPYPDDIVTRVSDRMVQFATPASHKGFGTSGVFPMFVISGQPVRGVVAFSVDAVWPNLSEFQIRLPVIQDNLSRVLIQLEEQCLKNRVGC